ncbi:aminoglycoside phosphotransferase family protein [Teredinibacter waterburyi]|uniref:aminoglycoside phosphotransferase family protein n=1 Tax=Teredinibacter waterburyi TaxID=1500538 RepID=UPI00165F8F96|nr:phosphotransferase [Teredinibacter waterburyi]
MAAGQTALSLSEAQRQQMIAELAQWVSEQLAQQGGASQVNYHLPITPDNWQPLGGDAGFRRYFRIAGSTNLLAVWAPPSTEKNHAFVVIAEFLRNRGIPAPQVLGFEAERGFLLVEDFGELMYLDQLNADNVDALYGQALICLLRIQQCEADKTIFEPYDMPILQREMGLFSEWFVPRLLGYELTCDEREMLARSFSILAESALEQPQVIVHRDFHSRNLVYRDHACPGIIDFQDALLGPITYDLVSLLKDCYIQWPADKVRAWALAYGAMAVEADIIAPTSEATFLRWFELMGLQRHIKVLGIFARLYLRDGKQAYLKDLPLVVEYTRSCARGYPELAEFSQWFEQTLMPIISTQSWMSER